MIMLSILLTLTIIAFLVMMWLYNGAMDELHTMIGRLYDRVADLEAANDVNEHMHCRLDELESKAYSFMGGMMVMSETPEKTPGV